MRQYNPKRVYLSGPMSGYPKLNFEAFDYYEKTLTERGFAVMSPARLDSDEFRAAVLRGDHDGENAQVGYDQKWVDSIVRDIEALSECNMVAVLPGWRKSLGARLEVTQAMSWAFPIYNAAELVGPPIPLSTEYLREILNAN